MQGGMRKNNKNNICKTGISKKVESDNNYPLISTDVKGFAEDKGFEHDIITPEYPQANGEAGGIIKLQNKTEQIAHNDGTPNSSAT